MFSGAPGNWRSELALRYLPGNDQGRTPGTMAQPLAAAAVRIDPESHEATAAGCATPIICAVSLATFFRAAALISLPQSQTGPCRSQAYYSSSNRFGVSP